MHHYVIFCVNHCWIARLHHFPFTFNNEIQAAYQHYNMSVLGTVELDSLRSSLLPPWYGDTAKSVGSTWYLV